MQKSAKIANFGTYGLNYWETVEDRWVHAAMRLTSIESSFNSYEFTAIVPGAYPGEAKMCISPPMYCYLFITAGYIYTTELYVITYTSGE